MPSKRTDRLIPTLKKVIAQFIHEENNSNAIVTVTNVTLSKDLKKGTVFLSIFPEDKSTSVMTHLEKHKKDLRNFVKMNTRSKFLPVFDLEIDFGEKNRQRIEELTR